jgi:hypothetical protein
MHGGAGDDVMVWSRGDGNDSFEGGPGRTCWRSGRLRGLDEHLRRERRAGLGWQLPFERRRHLRHPARPPLRTIVLSDPHDPSVPPVRLEISGLESLRLR